MPQSEVGTSYLSIGSDSSDFSDQEAVELFSEALKSAMRDILGSAVAKKDSVLILPPDATRFHSKAGLLTDAAAGLLGEGLGAIMPALGTHFPMSKEELGRMFPKSPIARFMNHDWRNDLTELGRLEGAFVERVSEGRLKYDWPAQVNKALVSGGYSMLLSIGQVVPHEVIGMANHAKNVFVGTGGKEAIDKSHFLGAAYGMERIMGRADTPVRALFDEAAKRFGAKLPPILYALTVVGRRAVGEGLALRGLFVGTGRECFEEAAALSRKVNVEILDEGVKKAVVWLDPEEYRSTWLGNKAVYRTRMTMADGGELLIMAPGLKSLGEDPSIDKLIRRYGYRPSKEIVELVAKEKDLADSLSAAAHLIHGSPEGRFTVRYCPGPAMSAREIESVGFSSGSLDQAMKDYDPAKLLPGFNEVKGERIFFVPNPAIGLWAERRRFGAD
jgi:nickel-dependent lactate racemase